MEEAGKALSTKDDGPMKYISRFVVSTHTMALAHQIDRWLEKGGHTAEGFADAVDGGDVVALPRKLTRKYAKNGALADAKRLPALLERAEEKEDACTMGRAENLVRQTLATALDKNDLKLETYYALLMMDGDKMGAILSGDEKPTPPSATATVFTHRCKKALTNTRRNSRSFEHTARKNGPFRPTAIWPFRGH